MQRFFSVLVAGLVVTSVAHAGASGTVSYKGQSWQVVDAVASSDFMRHTKLAFAPVRWDRMAWADNGKFDMLDCNQFEQGVEPMVLEISLDRDGKFRSLQMVKTPFGFEGKISQPASGEAARLEGINIERFGADAVKGQAKFQSGEYAVDLKFDLPVIKENAKVELPGTALPADGGEPGKAVLAALSAIGSGEVARMLAVTHPNRRERMTKMSAAPDFAAKLEKQKAMSPTDAKISGGQIHNDQARIHFSGTSGGQAKQYTAKLSRVAGTWYMESLGTRSSAT